MQESPIASPASARDSSTVVPVHEVVTIIIRLMVIFLSVNLLYYSTSSILFYVRNPSVPNFRPSPPYFLIPIFLSFTFVGLLWRFAPSISRRVTVGGNFTLHLQNLTLADLYSFGCLLVGLDFAVDAVPGAITSLYSLFRNHAATGSMPVEISQAIFIHVTQSIIGLALIFKSRRLGAKLVDPARSSPRAGIPEGSVSIENDPQG